MRYDDNGFVHSGHCFAILTGWIAIFVCLHIPLLVWPATIYFIITVFAWIEIIKSMTALEFLSQ